MAQAASSPRGDFVLGVFGGSGLYDLPGLTDVRERTLDTPFGAPSGPVVVGRVGATTVAFLARHGRGHRFSPSEINYRANVHAFKQLGVSRVLSISAVGSLRDSIAPGDLVLVDQFIDKTHGRASSFFGQGIVGHVSFADPVCLEWARVVAQAAALGDETPDGGAGRRLHLTGTYVCMEGPQFSTRAESNLHRSWGADVIGMTAATEAKLVREAEMCFALLALSTDYDCWRADEAAVTVGSVVEVLKANVARAEAIVVALASLGGAAKPQLCSCGRAAEQAILTAREAVSPEARQRLATLYGRYL
ncbi:MAG TPA: S-methyl-5'-thioadenosine phosphorylase [Polyangia bacterium]|jgi:5'-methylthioadenosine phosphorylase